LFDWLDAGPGVPAGALGRLAHATDASITIVARGDASTEAGDADAGQRLAQALRGLHGGPVVADCGRAESEALRAFVASADRSLLVLRPCYLALRRAVQAPRPTAVVLISEPDRALGTGDIEDVLGVPVVAEIAWDSSVARAVDSGLIHTRLPRRLASALREVAA
jgi:hypothetical protein